MKLIVSGGGTGGHFFPALEVIKQAEGRGVETLFVGTSRGIERSYEGEIPGERILLDTYPFRGVPLKERVRSVGGVLRGVSLLKARVGGEFRSLIFGGYPSVPVGLFTLMRRKSLYIHEQNSVPSMTNRSLSLFARKIFITFEYTRNYFRGGYVVRTGLPVRGELQRQRPDRDSARKALGVGSADTVILFMGGSQGARFLNDLAVEFARRTGYTTLLLSGERDYSRVKESAEGIPNLKVFPFRKDMALVYSAVDTAVCRAGAGTVSELSLFRIPALFIPYPYAAGDHQFYNAKEIEELGGGLVLRQESATPERVSARVEEILGNLESMGRAIGRFAVPDASAVILEEILKE